MTAGSAARRIQRAAAPLEHQCATGPFPAALSSRTRPTLHALVPPTTKAVALFRQSCRPVGDCNVFTDLQGRVLLYVPLGVVP
eukprot:scaffold42477_cov82-Phaeocystis_antarctica.AAC.6